MQLRFLCAVLALTVSACATAPTQGPVAPGPAVSAGPNALAPSRDPVAALRHLGAPDSMTTAQAASVLGRPDVERRDGVGALLTWRLESCALVLGFAHDRLQTADPGPRRPGEPAPTLETCLAEARARLPTS